MAETSPRGPEQNPIAAAAQRRLADAGIGPVQLKASSYDPDAFGDGEALFRVGSLLLRFVRDRGQEFLDIGFESDSGPFYPFGDVEVALGWRRLDDLVNRTQPEPIPDLLARFQRHRADLEQAFSAPRRSESRAKVEGVARQLRLRVHRRLIGLQRVAEYAAAARKHYAASLNGDGDAANRAYEKVAQIYRELRASGRSRYLLPLLTSDHTSVRCWAAAHALEFAPEQAVPVLEVLARERTSIVGLNAEMTLREWRSGRLRFP